MVRTGSQKDEGCTVILWSSLEGKSLPLRLRYLSKTLGFVRFGGPFWRCGNNDKDFKARDTAFHHETLSNPKARSALLCCRHVLEGGMFMCIQRFQFAFGRFAHLSQEPLHMAAFSGISCMCVLDEVPPSPLISYLPSTSPEPLGLTHGPESPSSSRSSHTVSLGCRETVKNRKKFD